MLLAKFVHTYKHTVLGPHLDRSGALAFFNLTLASPWVYGALFSIQNKHILIAYLHLARSDPMLAGRSLILAWV